MINIFLLTIVHVFIVCFTEGVQRQTLCCSRGGRFVGIKIFPRYKYTPTSICGPGIFLFGDEVLTLRFRFPCDNQKYLILAGWMFRRSPSFVVTDMTAFDCVGSIFWTECIHFSEVILKRQVNDMVSCVLCYAWWSKPRVFLRIRHLSNIWVHLGCGESLHAVCNKHSVTTFVFT